MRQVRGVITGECLLSMQSRRVSTRILTVVLAWLATRSVLLMLGPTNQHVSHDMRHYAAWGKTIAGGGFPSGDTWQYPPLAAVVMVAPRLIPFLDYLHAFVTLALLADLLVLLALLMGTASRAGAWTWTVGLFLLGSIVQFRYDLFVTAVAVLALRALPRQVLTGALVGVGALLKVWPLLLLVALPRDRRAVRALAACGVVVAAVMAVSLGHLGFLNGQRSRGLEIEAVAVTPWQLARLFGHPTKIVHRYGCAEFAFPGASAIALICGFATLFGLALVACSAWRRSSWSPAWGCDLALAAVLVAVVTSRVLSPQYLIWLIGIGAVAMTFPGSRQRPVVALILAAALLTQVVFPFGWDGLASKDPQLLSVLALVARNALLVAATVLSLARIWPSARLGVSTAEVVERQRATA